MTFRGRVGVSSTLSLTSGNCSTRRAQACAIMASCQLIPVEECRCAGLQIGGLSIGLTAVVIDQLIMSHTLEPGNLLILLKCQQAGILDGGYEYFEKQIFSILSLYATLPEDR